MAKLLAETHPDAHCELDFTTPLELAVATILSAQSTDKRVNEVTPIVFARYRTAADYAAADRAELEEMIKPTGFFRDKTDSLIKLGQALVERYGGEVPRTPGRPGHAARHRPQDRQRHPGQRVRRPGITVDTHFRPAGPALAAGPTRRPGQDRARGRRADREA